MQKKRIQKVKGNCDIVIINLNQTAFAVNVKGLFFRIELPYKEVVWKGKDLTPQSFKFHSHYGQILDKSILKKDSFNRF